MATPILSDLLEYDPTSKSGLRWKVSASSTALTGDDAGSFHPKSGYFHLRIKGKYMMAHRIVWALFNEAVPPGMQIDHIDGDRSNNRIENLRLADASENQCNKAYKPNRSGVKGLCWNKATQRWLGRIRLNKVVYSKFSKSRAEVESWLIETREKLHGEFARHR